MGIGGFFCFLFFLKDGEELSPKSFNNIWYGNPMDFRIFKGEGIELLGFR